MRSFIGWVGRKALLYLLLVAAIGLATLAAPRVLDAWSDGTIRSDLQDAGTTAKTIAAERAAGTRAFAQRASSLDTYTKNQLAERRRFLLGRRSDIAAVRAAQPGWFDALRPSRIIARQRAAFDALLVEQELAIIAVLLDRAARQTALARFRPLPTVEQHRTAIAQCEAARAAIRAFNRQPAVQRTIDDAWRGTIARLERDQGRACSRAATIRERRAAGIAAWRAYRAADAAVADLRDTTLARLARSKPEPVAGTTLNDILRLAALALIAILIAPMVVRTLLFFVIAPLAARRPAVRIASPGPPEPPVPPDAEAPAASRSLTLKDGQELLVRQGYFQSWTDNARQSTRWLLSARHPLTSIASGLFFLTEVRGTGARATISATASALTEVSALALPADASCVIRPRAIVAVVQPIGEPMRITSHYRFASLHAWATFQFRYLCFHGPATVVLAGGRGVRVERADHGRAFGSRQLVGFSPGLAYAITRTGTFWPYLLGRTDLFTDRVSGGDGVVLIEEAPAASASSRARRGLEGAADAVLKLFGV